MTLRFEIGRDAPRMFCMLAAFLLTGCDFQPTKEAQSREPVETSRFVLVPASNNPVMASGTLFLFAWRLDTKSGEVSVCTYDPGGWTNASTKQPAPESTSCSAPAK
jgi:hypothetical protein